MMKGPGTHIVRHVRRKPMGTLAPASLSSCLSPFVMNLFHLVPGSYFLLFSLWNNIHLANSEAFLRIQNLVHLLYVHMPVKLALFTLIYKRPLIFMFPLSDCTHQENKAIIRIVGLRYLLQELHFAKYRSWENEGLEKENWRIRVYGARDKNVACSTVPCQSGSEKGWLSRLFETLVWETNGSVQGNLIIRACPSCWSGTMTGSLLGKSTETAECGTTLLFWSYCLQVRSPVPGGGPGAAVGQQGL